MKNAQLESFRYNKFGGEGGLAGIQYGDNREFGGKLNHHKFEVTLQYCTVVTSTITRNTMVNDITKGERERREIEREREKVPFHHFYYHNKQQ